MLWTHFEGEEVYLLIFHIGSMWGYDQHYNLAAL
jgi:hypothetical protein